MNISKTDTAVAVVIYGGPSVGYDGLTIFQQNLFMNQLFESRLHDFESYIVHHTDPKDWYLQFVHQTSLATPIYISVVYNDEVVYSAAIIDIETTISNISKAVGNTHVHFYSEKDRIDFNRYLNNMRIKGFVNVDDVFFGAVEWLTIREGMMMPTLDEHLALLSYDTGEFIKAPQKLFIDNLERMKLSTDTKALSLYKIVPQL